MFVRVVVWGFIVRQWEGTCCCDVCVLLWCLFLLLWCLCLLLWCLMSVCAAVMSVCAAGWQGSCHWHIVCSEASRNLVFNYIMDWAMVICICFFNLTLFSLFFLFFFSIYDYWLEFRYVWAVYWMCELIFFSTYTCLIQVCGWWSSGVIVLVMTTLHCGKCFQNLSLTSCMDNI